MSELKKYNSFEELKGSHSTENSNGETVKKREEDFQKFVEELKNGVTGPTDKTEK
jgi:hypothetical protein